MKKETENKVKLEESTIFCDPKKGKEEKNKKHKGLWWKILAVLIVVFVGIPWLIVELAGTDNGTAPKPVAPFETRVERTVVYGEGTACYNAKNPDVNDIEADMKLLELLDVAKNCGEFTVEVSSKEKPYRLTLCFTAAHDASRETWFENTMVGYSCVLLALIDNVDEIAWSHPDGGDGDTGGYFTREDAEKFLGVGISRYGSSEKAVQLLLNDTGVFPY